MDNWKHLQLHNDRVVCPRCDGNGFVYKARLAEVDLILYVCDECEATWVKSEQIGIDPFKDLSTLIEERLGRVNGTDLENLGYDWYKQSV